MTADYFEELFEYDSSVNKKLLNVLRDTQSPTKAKGIFAHLVSAKQVWFNRIENDNKDVKIWPQLTFDECENLIDKNRKAYQKLLREKPDDILTKNVRYQNSKGIEYETPLRDILIHLLIHSGHHRGQLAKCLKETGNKPINTDYITYFRNFNP